MKRTSICSLLSLLPAAALMLSGCASVGNSLPSAGPSRAQVAEKVAASPVNASGMVIVDLNAAVANRLLATKKTVLFSDTFSSVRSDGYVIGAGDVIEVSIWEAPPAALFGSGLIDPRNGPATTRVTALPEQMVNSDGTINVPFAGQVQAAGRRPQQVEEDVTRRLKGKANLPQVLVRIIRNNTANVTIVGEVATSTRMPLTARGERLLDALAAAGGVRQPVNKMTLQLTRGEQVSALPLETIIRDPRQNIVLAPGDVITSYFQPLSYTVLGATGKNEEVNFEAQGITLAQALARSGGLQDGRADAQGVFIFRFESPEVAGVDKSMATSDGRVAVIYRIDLKDPRSFFLAQTFGMQNRDVMYVANAPAAELQKFVNIVGSLLSPAAILSNSIR